jgi:hypothetical protein
MFTVFLRLATDFSENKTSPLSMKFHSFTTNGHNLFKTQCKLLFQLKHRRHDEDHALELTSDMVCKEEVEKIEYKIIPSHGTQMELTNKSDKEGCRRIRHIQIFDIEKTLTIGNRKHIIKHV